MDGYYYLHTNGKLIYKRGLDGGQAADFRESSFVTQFWPMKSGDRGNAWQILVEATALGANKSRIEELAKKWKCTDEDAQTFADHAGFEIVLDGDAWCARPSWFTNLQESAAGFGKTALEACGELCKALGYKASKMWGESFFDLLKPASAEEAT